MSRPIAVLRPEPGNRVTAAAIEAAGRTAIRMPLFATRPIAWTAPDPTEHDALILTSANALRHGGVELAKLFGLPVHAVGEATADAARRAGFAVASIGDRGSEALLAQAEAVGVRQALHLAGRERLVEPGGIVTRVVTVYASEPIDVPAPRRIEGSVALVQSARAGARLAELGLDRSRIALVAVSERAAQAAGEGWETVRIAPSPDPDSLLDAAIALAD
ncbi:uroporphyrinogen-III synthase [Sphingomonas sp.]|uniref:uroporphyrinogen-III synthase n=1 Tax=Sphingomonas sp. TaxID=28214 RepID=UPI001B2717F6|nr:uroporphyrinogen-III synthase [Sphingomonas sp.]MBO9713981.1 uroporphyrinogen-III synthase [Sphingomonas sp.]